MRRTFLKTGDRCTRMVLIGSAIVIWPVLLFTAQVKAQAKAGGANDDCDPNAAILQPAGELTPAVCQCKIGYDDKSPDKSRPGRLCLQATPCKTIPADLIFLIDGSGSIGSRSFQGDVLRFIHDFTNLFDIDSSANTSRVGVIQFSDQIRHEFDLKDFQSKDQVLTAQQNIKYLTGLTQTGRAIMDAVTNGFSTANGARIAPYVSKVLIIITDGRSQDSVVAAADAARKAGIKIFVIGVTDHVQESELIQIAGNKSHVFLVNDYSGLNNRLTGTLHTEACKEGPLQPTCTTNADCVTSKNQVCKDGKCVCPDDLEFNVQTQACGGNSCPSSNPTCPPSEICVAAICRCPPGQTRHPTTGTCQSPTSMNCGNLPQLCKPELNEVCLPNGTCGCATGFQRNKDNICECVPHNACNPAIGCPPPAKCVREPGETFYTCQCDSAIYTMDASGHCIPDCSKNIAVCNASRNEACINGNCGCDSGYARNPDNSICGPPGVCDPASPNPCKCGQKCRKDNTGFPVCQCDADQEYNAAACSCQPSTDCRRNPKKCDASLNEVCLADGSCGCNTGFNRNPKNNICGPPGVCNRDCDPPKECKRDSSGYTTCQCPADQDTDSSGACIPKTCQKNPALCNAALFEVCLPSGGCGCDQGYQRNPKNNVCGPPGACNAAGQNQCDPPLVCPKVSSGVSTCQCPTPCKPELNEVCAPSGTCVCPTGLQRNPTNNICGPPNVVVCDPSIPNSCPSPKECPKTKDASGYYICVCPSDYDTDSSGRCIKNCRKNPKFCDATLNEVCLADGSCGCTSGQQRNPKNNMCGPPGVPVCNLAGSNQCDPPMTCQLDSTGIGICKCPLQCNALLNEVCLSDGTCGCPSGMQRNAVNNVCGPPGVPVCNPSLPNSCPPPKICPPNKDANGNYVCICPSDYDTDANGNCVKNCQKNPRFCDPTLNEVCLFNGSCGCSGNYQRNPENNMCGPPHVCPPNGGAYQCRPPLACLQDPNNPGYSICTCAQPCKPELKEVCLQNGICGCQAGEERNPQNNVCGPPGVIGCHPSLPNPCPSPKICPPNKDANGNYICTCPSTYDTDANGNCVKNCLKNPQFCDSTLNEICLSNGACGCATGQQRNPRNNMCGPPNVDVCPPNGGANQCVPPLTCQQSANGFWTCQCPVKCRSELNEVCSIRGICECQSGFQRNPFNNICGPPNVCNPNDPSTCQSPKQCNQTKDSTGYNVCVCPPEYDVDPATGNCVTNCLKNPKLCNAALNEVCMPNGACACESGFVRNPYNNICGPPGVYYCDPNSATPCPPPKICPRNSTAPFSICACPFGFLENPNTGDCERPTIISTTTVLPQNLTQCDKNPDLCHKELNEACIRDEKGAFICDCPNGTKRNPRNNVCGPDDVCVGNGTSQCDVSKGQFCFPDPKGSNYSICQCKKPMQPNPTTGNCTDIQCGSTVCDSLLGLQCDSVSNTCICPNGQARANSADLCRNAIAVNLPIIVVRKNNDTYTYTPDFGNNQSTIYKDITKEFIQGVGATYNTTPLAQQYITSNVIAITNPANEPPKLPYGLWFNVTVWVTPDMQGQGEKVYNTLMDTIKQRFNYSVGGTTLYINPYQWNPFDPDIECGGVLCRKDLGLICINGKCQCNATQARQNFDEAKCQNAVAIKFPVIVNRNNSDTLYWNVTYGNITSPLYIDIGKLFVYGTGVVYNGTDLASNFIRTDVNAILNPADFPLGQKSGLWFNVTVWVTPDKGQDGQNVYLTLMDTIVKKYNYSVGGTSLYIDPLQYNPFNPPPLCNGIVCRSDLGLVCVNGVCQCNATQARSNYDAEAKCQNAIPIEFPVIVLRYNNETLVWNSSFGDPNNPLYINYTQLFINGTGVAYNASNLANKFISANLTALWTPANQINLPGLWFNVTVWVTPDMNGKGEQVYQTLLDIIKTKFNYSVGGTPLYINPVQYNPFNPPIICNNMLCPTGLGLVCLNGGCVCKAGQARRNYAEAQCQNATVIEFPVIVFRQDNVTLIYNSSYGDKTNPIYLNITQMFLNGTGLTFNATDLASNFITANVSGIQSPNNVGKPNGLWFNVTVWMTSDTPNQPEQIYQTYIDTIKQKFNFSVGGTPLYIDPVQYNPFHPPPLCFGVLCRSDLGENCTTTGCGCVGNFGRAKPTDVCERSENFTVPIVIIKQGNQNITFNISFETPTDPIYVPITYIFNNGTDWLFGNSSACKNLYLGSVLNHMQDPSVWNPQFSSGVLFNFTVRVKPGSINSEQELWDNCIWPQIVAMNCSYGGTNLYANCSQPNPFATTLAPPTTTQPPGENCNTDYCLASLGVTCKVGTTGVQSCECPEGQARATKDAICEKAIAVNFPVIVLRRDEVPYVWSNVFLNQTSTPYIDITYLFGQGAGKVFNISNLSSDYFRTEVVNISNPFLHNQTLNRGLWFEVRVWLKPDLNGQDKLVRDIFIQTITDKFNYSVGGTPLYINPWQYNPWEPPTLCGGIHCKQELGEICNGSVCVCPYGFGRAKSTDMCTALDSYQMYLIVIREGIIPLTFNSSYTNPQDEIYQRVIPKFITGINAIFGQSPYSDFYVLTQVGPLQNALDFFNNKSLTGVLFPFVVSFRQGASISGATLWNTMWQNILAQNYSVGGTDLFVNPWQYNPLGPCFRNKCASNAFCYEINGQPVCQCPPGFLDKNPANPGTNCVAACGYNECLNQQDNDCSINAECRDTNCSYSCACKALFDDRSSGGLSGRVCIPNPCFSAEESCGQNMTCSVVDGQAACVCPPNFVDVRRAVNALVRLKLPIVNCMPIELVNECELGLTDCSAVAICIDLLYGYRCECPAGYIDAGTTENAGRLCQARLCSQCGNHGSCETDATTKELVCRCDKYYRGARCQYDDRVILLIVLAIIFFLMGLCCLLFFCLRCRCFRGVPFVGQRWWHEQGGESVSDAYSGGSVIGGAGAMTIPRAKLKAGAGAGGYGGGKEIEERRLTNYLDEDYGRILPRGGALAGEGSLSSDAGYSGPYRRGRGGRRGSGSSMSEYSGSSSGSSESDYVTREEVERRVITDTTTTQTTTNAANTTAEFIVHPPPMEALASGSMHMGRIAGRIDYSTSEDEQAYAEHMGRSSSAGTLTEYSRRPEIGGDTTSQGSSEETVIGQDEYDRRTLVKKSHEYEPDASGRGGREKFKTETTTTTASFYIG